MENRVIVILGCTASGKNELGRRLAADLGGEIISIDSMKVYRGLDIGTAKPSPADRAAVPHHLIDIVDPWEAFSAAQFVEHADRAGREIHCRGRPVIAVGGTMLYFKAWFAGLLPGPSADTEFRTALRARAAAEGLAALHAELARVDPEAAARIHRNDLRRIERALEVYHLTGRPISAQQTQWEENADLQTRAAEESNSADAPTSDFRLPRSHFLTSPRNPDWRWLLIALRRPRDAANRRINERVRRMIASGLIDEARRVWDDPRGVSTQARQAVGYAELFDHFEGRAALDEAVEKIKIHSRRLAKHQRTWLRPMGGLHWVDLEESDTAASLARRVVALASVRMDAPGELECRPA